MNPRRKRGEVREDGMVFWGLDKGYECWVTSERFQERRRQENEKMKLWRLRNPKKAKESALRSRNKNIEKVRARTREWQVKNPEKAYQASRSWRLKNRERERLTCRLWRESNRAASREASRNWSKNNPARVCEIRQKRVATKRKAIPDDIWQNAVDQIFEISRRVSKCLGIPHSVDHIFPLAKGGSHCHRNLQILPAAINHSKSCLLRCRIPSCYRCDGWAKGKPAFIEMQ